MRRIVTFGECDTPDEIQKLAQELFDNQQQTEAKVEQLISVVEPLIPLTDEQKLWAKRMDLTEEEYKKFQKPIDAAKLEEDGKGGLT